MEVVLWICGSAALLAVLAYAAIGICLLAAKWRMAHAPSRARATLAAGSIVDWRYPAP